MRKSSIDHYHGYEVRQCQKHCVCNWPKNKPPLLLLLKWKSHWLWIFNLLLKRSCYSSFSSEEIFFFQGLKTWSQVNPLHNIVGKSQVGPRRKFWMLLHFWSMKPYNISDLLKALHRVCLRDTFRGIPLACRCLLVVFTCVFKWTNTVRCHCIWRPPRHFFGKSSVYVYPVDNRLCKDFPFSLWRKGHW